MMNNQTAQLLKAHFDIAFTAPQGIQKLRELILTLAMQGKLIPQDPTDPPARELLKDIEAEKQKLIQSGKIKKPKPLPPIKQEELPYELPKGWEWGRLGEIGVWQSGSTPDRSNKLYYGGGIPWVKSGEVKRGRIKSTEETITQMALDKCSLQLNPEGSVLVAMYGANIGETGILEIDATTNQAVCACKTYKSFNENYLLRLLASLKPHFINQGAGAAQPNISREKIVNTVIPLPPLPEQHRIVAKIDQLMALCDELEKLKKEQEAKRLSVHASAIKGLLEQNDNSAWGFIKNHFSELYSVKENIAELRKAILQLAVMGKLVPQDPNDPPASELLKDIEAEKQKLIQSGKIKKPKPLPPIKQEEIPYELPKGWEWVRLGEISLYSDSGWSPQCLPHKRTAGQWGVLKVSAVSWDKFNPNENKALPPEKSPRLNCVVEVRDLLISRANTEELVAKSVVVKEQPDKLMMSDKIVRFKLADNTNIWFVNHAHGANHSRSYYLQNCSGTSSSMKNVTRQVMENLPLPLPPLPEQHRIVAKIDQLMALCDELEKQIQNSSISQNALLGSLMESVQNLAQSGGGV